MTHWINLDKIRVTTHYGRVTDFSGNPDISLTVDGLDESESRHRIVTSVRDGKYLVGIDKDNYHANLMGFLIRRLDPDWAGQFHFDRESEKIAAELSNFLVPLYFTEDEAPDKDKKLEFERFVQHILESTTPTESPESSSAQWQEWNTRMLKLLGSNEFPFGAKGSLLSKLMVFRDLQSDDPDRQAYWLEKIEELKSRSVAGIRPTVPLRQFLKQIVLPAPAEKSGGGEDADDVVFTPLPSLPLLNKIAVIAKETRCYSLFFRKNDALGKPQITGTALPMSGFRYALNGPSDLTPGKNLQGALVDCRSAADHWIKALMERRMYLINNGLPPESMRSKTDLDQKVINRGVVFFACLDDEFAGNPIWKHCSERRGQSSRQAGKKNPELPSPPQRVNDFLLSVFAEHASQGVGTEGSPAQRARVVFYQPETRLIDLAFQQFLNAGETEKGFTA